MKNTYINPEMKIATFNKNDVVTVSGEGLTAKQYVEKNTKQIFGKESNDIKSILVF